MFAPHFCFICCVSLVAVTDAGGRSQKGYKKAGQGEGAPSQDSDCGCTECALGHGAAFI